MGIFLKDLFFTSCNELRSSQDALRGPVSTPADSRHASLFPRFKICYLLFQIFPEHRGSHIWQRFALMTRPVSYLFSCWYLLISTLPMLMLGCESPLVLSVEPKNIHSDTEGIFSPLRYTYPVFLTVIACVFFLLIVSFSDQRCVNRIVHIVMYWKQHITSRERWLFCNCI